MIVELDGIYQDGTEPGADLTPSELAEQRIVMGAGEDVSLLVTVRNAARNIVDITGWTFHLGIRRRQADASFLARAGVITGLATAGLVTFTLRPTDTLTATPTAYVYDVWGTDPGGLRHRLIPLSTLSVEPAAFKTGDTVTA